MSREAWVALREKIRAEQNLVVVFGSEVRGHDIERLVSFASTLAGAKLICLGDYANSRGASEMGLYPDLLPGYEPLNRADKFQQEWGKLPTEKGLTLPEMVEAAKAGKLKALYVVDRTRSGAWALTLCVLQEFRRCAGHVSDRNGESCGCRLPAANAYEKTGTYTNTCGDLQLVNKAGEVTNTKSDFEMIVRIADAMGFDVRVWCLRQRDSLRHGPDARRAIGEADRHAVCSSQQPGTENDAVRSYAILDEIQRVVAGYDISRVNLLAGNDQHIEIAASGPSAMQSPELIVPAMTICSVRERLALFQDFEFSVRKQIRCAGSGGGLELKIQTAWARVPAPHSMSITTFIIISIIKSLPWSASC